MPNERLTSDELEYLCFGSGDEVLGDERGAAVLHTQRFGSHLAAWLMLVAVEPGRQGKGRGKKLVRAVAAQASSLGARELLLASAVPRYVWPGVDLGNTRAGMLLEACGFARDWLGINMAIATSFRRDPPAGCTVARETGTGAHEFAAVSYPSWVPELDRAVALGTAFAARDAKGATIGFGCHSVNRSGWIGPMATDPASQHGGVGSAVVASVCADLAARGHAAGEIAWVSNLRFYGKCGARVSRLFMGGKLPL
jgi:GNAT superfamily N-acetyltransferase